MKPITQRVNFKNNDIANHARADLLRIIDDICQKHNLRYFGYRDVLVGAVHYNDFIPNGLDSTTEIGLLRNEYDKLCELLYKHEKDYDYTIIDRYKSGAKMLNIAIAKKIEIEQADITVSDVATVSINAFDFLPESEAEQKLHLRKINKLVSSYEKMVNLTPPYTEVPMNLRKVFFLFMDTLLYGKRNPKKTYRKLFKAAKKYKDTEYIAQLILDKSVVLKLSDVFPLKRIKVNNTEINIPQVYNKWTVEIDSKLMEQTRTIQKLDLVLLNEFDTVCRKIGVNYFICGGTMLGYKRHGGFIPWDDDIDVGMLRADYDKFIKEADKHLGDDFFLQTRQSDPKIPYLFSKVRLNGTAYITNYNEKRDFHKGICLDLFPFDYVPNSLDERRRFVNKALFWSNVHFETVNNQPEKTIYHSRAKSIYEWWARTYFELRRKLICLIPLKLTEHMYIKKATALNEKANELSLTTVASLLPTYTYTDVSDIQYQDIEFDGVRVMALTDMDKFLTMQYGDYMQLPLLHRRVGHDLIHFEVSDEIADKYHIYD